MKGFKVIRNSVAVAAVAVAAGAVGVVSGSAGSASANSVDRAADTLAIQNAQACYGRAQDVVYRNYADESRAKSQGITAFEQCFTPNAHVKITVHGNQVLDDAASIPDWVNFVFQFGKSNGITSARHVLGNTEVNFTGEDSATFVASANTPHFIGQGVGADHQAILWVTGDYRAVVHRINGRWLITDFLINADELAQTSATYPFDVSDGSGNIGFPDPSVSSSR